MLEQMDGALAANAAEDAPDATDVVSLLLLSFLFAFVVGVVASFWAPGFSLKPWMKFS